MTKLWFASAPFIALSLLTLKIYWSNHLVSHLISCNNYLPEIAMHRPTSYSSRTKITCLSLLDLRSQNCDSISLLLPYNIRLYSAVSKLIACRFICIESGQWSSGQELKNWHSVNQSKCLILPHAGYA